MRLLLASVPTLLLCLLAGMPAQAQQSPAQPETTTSTQAEPQATTQPATATSPSASADAGSQVVCRSENQHGSMIPTRICHTQREWDAMRSQGQRSVNAAQTRGLSSQPMGK
jgi:hypothetical protein